MTEASPTAQVIFDRFHVQRLAALQKNRWNLTRIEWEKLGLLQRTSRRIYLAYRLTGPW